MKILIVISSFPAGKHVAGLFLPELVKELTALPPDLADQETALATAAKLSDPKVREQLALAWQKFFREKYQRIVGK